MDCISQSMPLSQLQTSGSCNGSLEHPPASPPSSTGNECFYTAMGPSTPTRNINASTALASSLVAAGSRDAFPACMKRLEEALVSAARCCGEAAALKANNSAADLNLDSDVRIAYLGMCEPPAESSVPCQECLKLKHQLQDELASTVSSDISEAYSGAERNLFALTAKQNGKSLCPASKAKSVAQLATYAAEYLDSWGREGQVLGGRVNFVILFSSMPVFCFICLSLLGVDRWQTCYSFWGWNGLLVN